MVSYENEIRRIRVTVEEMQPTQTEIEETRNFLTSARSFLQEMGSAIEARKERESQVNRRTQRRTGALARQFPHEPHTDSVQETIIPPHLKNLSKPRNTASGRRFHMFYEEYDVEELPKKLSDIDTHPLSHFEETRRQLSSNVPTQPILEFHQRQNETGIIKKIKARIVRLFKKKR